MRYLALFVVATMSLHAVAADPILPDQISPEYNAQQDDSFFSHPQKLTEPLLSAAEVANLVETLYPGQVINVSLQTGSILYGVKILNNGHMKIIYVDANNGKISSFPN